MLEIALIYVYVLLVSLFTANKVGIASLGGIDAIIKAMSTHMDNSGVQENACGALWNLAVNDGLRLSCSPLSFYSSFH